MTVSKVFYVTFLIVVPFALNYFSSISLDRSKFSALNRELYAQEPHRLLSTTATRIANNRNIDPKPETESVVHIDLADAHVNIPTDIEKPIDVQVEIPKKHTEQIEDNELEANKNEPETTAVSVTVKPANIPSTGTNENKGWLAMLFEKLSNSAGFFAALKGMWDFFMTVPVLLFKLFLSFF